MKNIFVTFTAILLTMGCGKDEESSSPCEELCDFAVAEAESCGATPDPSGRTACMDECDMTFSAAESDGCTSEFNDLADCGMALSIDCSTLSIDDSVCYDVEEDFLSCMSM